MVRNFFQTKLVEFLACLEKLHKNQMKNVNIVNIDWWRKVVAQKIQS